MSFNLTIDIDPVVNLIRVMPREVLRSVRKYTFGMFVEHRLEWLRTKGLRFGRGGQGILVKRVGEGGRSVGPKEVGYYLPPKDEPASDGEARAMLADYNAEIFTGNIVLPIHQFGEDIRSSKYMAIPVKTSPGSPEAWRARNPGKDLIAKWNKRKGQLRLMEVEPATTPGGRTRLRTRFLLTKFVDMKPTLKFYETWEAQDGERQRRWTDAVDKLFANLVKPTVRRSLNP